MKNRSYLFGISGLLMSAALAAPLGTPADAAPISKRMVSGDEAFQRVTALTTQIPWYTSLEHAQSVAQKEQKPIFWLHMLGPLNGKT